MPPSCLDDPEPVALPLSLVARADEVPSFAKDVPHVKTGEPLLQFNGKDLTGFYTYTHDHKLEDPKQGLHGPGRRDPHLGRGIRRRHDREELPRLSPDRRVEVGRRDLGAAQGQDP